MYKKIITAFMLFFSVVVFSQTFIEKYKKSISKKDGEITQWRYINLTVLFNEDSTGDIVFYYSDGRVVRFHQITDVEKNVTVKKEEYQIIECIESETFTLVAIQYFSDDQTLRVMSDKNNYIEFYKW
jgi:hypothetical protein